MEISRSQIEEIHASMTQLLENANYQDSLNTANIRGTNRVILIFTLLGAILTIAIFIMFFSFTKAINHSYGSMKNMQHQVADLRASMDSITNHVENMGQAVESLSYMNDSVGQIALKTGIINSYIAALNEQSGLLSSEVSYVRYHVDIINQRFSSINQAVNGVAYSMHETARPIKQFIPLP